jgi:membrane protease YdiL (CAAX protease family)
VRGGDLILILIVSLGAARLAVPLMFMAILRGGGELQADPQRVLALTVAIFAVQTVVLIGMIRIVVIGKRGLSWSDLGLRPASRNWYLGAIAVAVVTVSIVGLVNALVSSAMGGDFRNPQLSALAPGGFTWVGLIVMTVMTGVVAPFSEELAFRGLLYAWLRSRIGIIAATIVSSGCFAVLHGVPILMPALFLVGVILVTVYQRSGSLWVAIVTHGVFNTIMTLGLYVALAAGIELP